MKIITSINHEAFQVKNVSRITFLRSNIIRWLSHITWIKFSWWKRWVNLPNRWDDRWILSGLELFPLPTSSSSHHHNRAFIVCRESDQSIVSGQCESVKIVWRMRITMNFPSSLARRWKRVNNYNWDSPRVANSVDIWQEICNLFSS